MEVHQHAHTPRRKCLPGGRQGRIISGPASGGIMLFLAVFCGFMAENQREHYIEHERAKVYAANMYSELLKDTLDLEEQIVKSRLLCRRLDSFCMLESERSTRKISNGMFYYYSNFSADGPEFAPNNATLEQLKNSGNLRYLSNKVANEVSEYDRRLRDLKNEMTIAQLEYQKITELRLKIFDGVIASNLYDSEDGSRREWIFGRYPPLINEDPKLMREFTGWVKWVSGVYEEQIYRHFIPLKKKATGLMGLLKEEYHLK